MRRPRLILASQSPRRHELLALGKWTFDTQAADVNEDPLEGEAPKDYVLRLAEEKARAIADKLEEDAIVVAADTTVVLDGRILGKPADAAEAEQMLAELGGRSHQVFTGVALLHTGSGELVTDLAESPVPMQQLEQARIEAYVATGDPMDKAGGYGIQNSRQELIGDFADCFANVMGLPLCHLQRNLREWGLAFEVDLPAACQAHINYVCPVYQDILTWK